MFALSCSAMNAYHEFITKWLGVLYKWQKHILEAPVPHFADVPIFSRVHVTYLFNNVYFIA